IDAHHILGSGPALGPIPSSSKRELSTRYYLFIGTFRISSYEGLSASNYAKNSRGNSGRKIIRPGIDWNRCSTKIRRRANRQIGRSRGGSKAAWNVYWRP